MRHFAKYLAFIAGITACDSATKAVSPETADQLPALTSADASVDPSTLIPEPPPGAACRIDG
jgi:hypothetical protein